MRGFWMLVALGVLGIDAGTALGQSRLEITVSATGRAYQNAPVFALLTRKDARNLVGYLVLRSKSEEIPAQLHYEAGQPRLVFVVPRLEAGEQKRYKLEARQYVQSPRGGAEVKPVANGVEIWTDTVTGTGGREAKAFKLFTRYVTRGGANKPYFFPILAPDGTQLTRKWPQEEDPAETHDHPHHRGLWFTHGEVNGVDFWSESPKAGKTVHEAVESMASGTVFGELATKTRWLAPDGTQIATDRRLIRVFPLANGDTIMDFEIRLEPKGKPLHFGDTKEGTFGIRVPDPLAPSLKRGGHSENANGEKDANIWGKKATWVDYWGDLGGKTYGIAMLDSPQNLRHPQTWHARDYGLFAVNPFGLHDFKMGDKGAGDHRVALGETFVLRYRLVFHKGDVRQADIAGHFEAYANLPVVSVRR